MDETEHSRLRQHLYDVRFPARKEVILKAARDSRTPPEYMKYLRQLPDKRYLDFDSLRIDINLIREGVLPMEPTVSELERVSRMDRTDQPSDRLPGYSGAGVFYYINDIDWPRDKGHIIQAAKEKFAPPLIIDRLERLPDREYRDVQDVEDEVSRERDTRNPPFYP